ncbi:hypothetical protein BV25DRAFT_1829822 [Artomyces pyxidatus]|uniref:Uncharacterized protein n=1 Tax=Artomyces pyxidatus TaxID=48021 RepID=A0ACB8SQ15_9AGAM|nr:hypothetical protein BV25DRAFT_1829822 [Artomyces pyxidatus]
MGKLNIAHHKSYHPYRQDNIARVRRDEEQARLKESQDEDRALLADSESRVDTLRARAGIESLLPTDTPAEASASQSSSIPTSSRGHINLFEDLEQHALALSVRSSKKAPAIPEADRGVPLAPTKKDLKPWYSARRGERDNDAGDDRRLRDLSRKSHADPISSIPAHLTRTSPSKPRAAAPAASPLEGRLARESSERERALALKARKQRELEGSATPSTVHGGYGDLFNRREVEDARRERDRGDWRRRGWDDDSRPRRGR